MGRARLEEIRVRGPYLDTSKGLWRIVVVDADGTKRQMTFATEANALRQKAIELGEIKAGQETTIEQVIGLYDEQQQRAVKDNLDLSIENILYRLRMFFGPILSQPIGSVDERMTKDLRTGKFKIVPGKSKPDLMMHGLATRPLKGNGDKPASKTSQLNTLAVVRTFCRWCLSQGLVRRDPMAWWDPKLEPKREHGRLGNSKLTLPQAETFAAVAFDVAMKEKGESDIGIRAAAVALTLATGLRATSITDLDVRSIERRRGIMADPPDPWVLKHRRAKRRSDAKYKEVPLEQQLEEILEPFIVGRGGDHPLFTTSRPRGSRGAGSRLSPLQVDQIRALSRSMTVAETARKFEVSWTAVSRILKGETHRDDEDERMRPGRGWLRQSVHKICDLANVPRDTAHAIRGQIASKYAAEGNIAMAQWLLMHSRRSTTTQSYASESSVALGKQRQMLRAFKGGRP